MDSEADLRHRTPVLGNRRGAREVGPRGIPRSRSVFEVATLSLMSEIDIRPRQQREKIGHRPSRCSERPRKVGPRISLR